MSATPTVESLHAQWVAAFNAHDLDRHMALYHEDAMLFGAVDELQDRRPAIRVSAEVAVTAGHVDFADGDKPDPYRMTWVLVRRDGNWRIVQHHGSPRRGSGG